MTTLLSPPAPVVRSRRRQVARLTMVHAVIWVSGLAFLAFVLYMTATDPDWSEVKTVLIAGAGGLIREVVPVVKAWLRPTTDAFASGGQVE